MNAGARLELKSLIARYPALRAVEKDIEQAFLKLAQSLSNGGTIYVCGNGGSASDSEHMVGELMKSFKLPRPLPEKERERFTRLFKRDGETLADNLECALPALSLPSQLSISTAFANDVGYQYGFAQLVYGYGRPGDCLILISTSGNSPNVLHAAMVGKVREMENIGLTGARGGKLETFCSVCVKAPGEENFCVQEYHLPIYHALCAMLELEFFGK